MNPEMARMNAEKQGNLSYEGEKCPTCRTSTRITETRACFRCRISDIDAANASRILTPRHYIPSADTEFRNAAEREGLAQINTIEELTPESRRRLKMLGVNYGGANSYPLYEYPYNITSSPKYHPIARRLPDNFTY